MTGIREDLARIICKKAEMHVSTKSAMSCWTDKATMRPWLRNRMGGFCLDDLARGCLAWLSDQDRTAHNGNACDGCARLSEGD